jgi:preprotein translocase subunit YajC
MNSIANFLLMAGPQTAATAGTTAQAAPGSALMSFLPLVLIIVIFYFLLIRPQNKKQKETKKMLDSLRKGDKVVTIGGIHGTIKRVKEQTVVVQVSETQTLEFTRSAISNVTSREDNDDEEEETKDKKADGTPSAADKPKEEQAQ